MDPTSRRPPSPMVAAPDLTDDERVDQAGLGSFPASDPPPWTSGREGRARHNLGGELDDLDGGGVRERARRRRHID